jgi:uncharacterized protein YegJ (DUF2314 family)
MPKKLIPVFIPSLGALLLAAENKKGSSLTEQEVLRIRDQASCIMMERKDAVLLSKTRGRDLDPENAWFDFQHLRRSLGRKPDLDPGARVQNVAKKDADMAAAMDKARQSLDEFDLRSKELAPKGAVPMLKTLVVDEGHRVFLWLTHAKKVKKSYRATVFELPPGISKVKVGDELEVKANAVADWMINDAGKLHGGFTLRVHRKRLEPEEQKEFDAHLGVSEYL